MGTEQQQELKSEKPRHKSMPKNIPFTDHSIENFKPSIIARKIRVGFPKGPYTNNLKIVLGTDLCLGFSDFNSCCCSVPIR